MRPVDIVRKVAPRARPAYLQAFENGDALFAKHGITTPLRMAQFLAQVLHESGGLKIEWESGAYSAERLMQIFGVGRHSAAVTTAEARRLAKNGPAIFERVYGLGNPRKAKELGNLQPGDGFKFRGGGIMQTTGRANYRRMGKLCGVDFESHPELVTSSQHALKPALAEWTAGNMNVLADKSDLRGITRKINGGYNGLADRQAWYKKVRPLCEGLTLSTSAPAPEKPPAMQTPPGTHEGGGAVVGGAGAAITANEAGLPIGWVIAIGIAAAAVIGLGVFLWKRRK